MKNELEEALDVVASCAENPVQGLPEEVFLFATSITPMVNVDLLIRDDKGRILLAWRDDEFYRGWHIPGGIVRLKETLEERIIRDSEKEIGCRVVYDKEPLEIVESIFPDMKMRGHFISFLYNCSLPDGYTIDNHSKTEHDVARKSVFAQNRQQMPRIHQTVKHNVRQRFF